MYCYLLVIAAVLKKVAYSPFVECLNAIYHNVNYILNRVRLQIYGIFKMYEYPLVFSTTCDESFDFEKSRFYLSAGWLY